MISPSPDAVASGVNQLQARTATPASEHLSSSSPSEVLSHAEAHMTDASEKVQTLADMGQLSSWPNVRVAQQVLDWMVEATGLPWWATIALVTLSVRILILPVVFKGQANAIRLANINPRMQEHMKDLQYAKRAGDARLMGESAGAVQKLMKDNNCSPFGSFIAPAVQMPIFISFFFALRGLANAGLPSMQVGGLSWFTDLTVADPYLVLPVVSCAMTLAVLETGAEMGGATQTPTPQAKMVRNGLRVLTVFSVFLVYSFPAAVFCFWATNNTFSLVQLVVLQLPRVRTALNLPARLVHDKEETKGKPLGFWDSVKAGKASQATPEVRRDRVPSALQHQRQMDEGREAAVQRLMQSQGQTAPAPAPSAVMDAPMAAETATALPNKGDEKRNRVQAAREKRAVRKRF